MTSPPIPARVVGHSHVARVRLTSTDVLLLLMAVIWGMNISVVKFGTTVMHPLAYNSLRVLIAAVTLLGICAVFHRVWPTRRQALTLFGLGLLGNGLYQILFVEGIARTRAGNAALVLAATPAFILILSWLRGLEPLRSRAAIGVSISIAGVLLVVGTGAIGASRATLAGDAMVLAACCCWAVFTVLLKPYTHQVRTLHIAAFTMLGGLPFLFIAAIPDLAGTSWSSVPAAAWYSMFFSGVAALVLAYLFWYRGVKLLGPTRTAMYANLQPAIALMGAWALLGEVPTTLQGIGAGGIITGLLLARA